MIDYVIEIVHSDVPTNVRGPRSSRGYLTIAEADDRLCLFMRKAAAKAGYCHGRVWARDRTKGQLIWPAHAVTNPEAVWGVVHYRSLEQEQE